MSPHPSLAWDTRLPQHSQPERSYLERYIFFFIFFILFVAILKKVQNHRPSERFDPALDELDVEAGTDVDGGWSLADDGGLYWDDASGVALPTAPCGPYHDNSRSNDDTYGAAVSSLVSFDDDAPSPADPFNGNSSSNVQPPEYDIQSSNAQKVQYLVAQLRTASYAARNEPEGSPGRRGIEVLRRRILEMVVIGNTNYASQPLPDLMDAPPPAYSDIVQVNGRDFVPPPSPPHSRPAPPRLIIP
ncbi:hypothetical protein GALMADRAFT_259539 [Galerina marginata CBS 339.88]|uniref:Uncharacterized protein n=1 Tax=Galerina marginata (strain CBS 339.88) TaxID=685588 RepID=A0A067S603_GALM3|nr:hypothetical protein GALMADRAFT_259539 [Galerina marginata CBS 339.88]